MINTSPESIPHWQNIGLPSDNVRLKNDQGKVEENWHIIETHEQELVGEGPKVHVATLEKEYSNGWYTDAKTLVSKTVPFHELVEMNQLTDKSGRVISTVENEKNFQWIGFTMNVFKRTNAGTLEFNLSRGENHNIDTTTTFHDVLSLRSKGYYPGNQRIAAMLVAGSHILNIVKAPDKTGAEKMLLTSLNFTNDHSDFIALIEDGEALSIGRTLQPGQLTSANMSGNHLAITRSGDSVAIEDHSTNGTVIIRPETVDDLRYKITDEITLDTLVKQLQGKRSLDARRTNNILDLPGMYLSEVDLAKI